MSDNLDLHELEGKLETRKRKSRHLWRLLAITLIATMGVGGVVTYIGIRVKTSQPGQPLSTPLVSALLLFLVMLGLGTIGIILFVSLKSLGDEVHRQREANETLHQAVHGLPERRVPLGSGSGSGKTPRGRIARAIGSLLGLGAILLLSVLITQAFLPTAFPDMSPKTRSNMTWFIAIAILAVAIPTIQRVIARRQHKPLPSLWQNLLTSIFYFGFLFAIVEMEELDDWLHSITGSQFAGVGLILLFALAVMGVMAGIFWFPFAYVMNALKQGNYDRALQRVERMKRFLGRTNPMLLFVEGTVLLFAGRYGEAEEILRSSLATGQNDTMLTDSQTVTLENLGWALLGLGRYDEAIAALEGAIKTRPEGTDSYNGLAQVYLTLGNNPQRALELTDRAVTNKRKRMHADRHVWGEILANRAWALAQLGRHDEAEHVLDQAFREADHGFKASLAGLHYRAAQLKRLQGKDAEVVKHLTQAQQIDPNGAFGKRANDELRKAG
jgi:tetratricopeptide (TPR) repeat protein